MLSFRFPGFLFASVLACASSALRAQQPTAVFEDTFADGERLTYSLPGSISWYQNVPASVGNTQAGNLAVRNGALDFVVNGASRALWTYFPTVNLRVGDRILLLMEFQVTAPVANGFRLGLCNTNGVAPQIGDGPGPAGAYQGYGLENLFVIKRSGPAAADSDGALLSQLSNAAGQTIWGRVSQTDRGIQGIPLQANTTYTLMFSVVRTGTNAATITTALSGGGLSTTNTATVTDSANIFTTFDTFSVAFIGGALSGDMLINRAGVFTTGEITQLNPPRLINLSILTSIPTSGDSFTMGYVVGGAGTSGSKPLVIRAAGPSLVALGVQGTLDDPKMELFTGTAKTGENDNWGGGAEVSAAMAAVGAFGFSGPNSRDAAVVANVDSGASSSVKVSANGTGTGTVIAEIYDASPSGSFRANTPRLINVSVLKHLGTSLTAGFVVSGSGPKTVLIRAIGPTLGTDFGVAGVVADPRLAVLDSTSAQIAANDNWGGDTALSAAFTKVGAFGLPANSRDAALLATLQPGNYTVQVSGVNNTTGVALVEVYDVP